MKTPRLRIAIAAAFFVYVLLIRTNGIISTFLVLGDQVRDWTIALDSWLLWVLMTRLPIALTMSLFVVSAIAVALFST